MSADSGGHGHQKPSRITWQINQVTYRWRRLTDKTEPLPSTQTKRELTYSGDHTGS